MLRIAASVLAVCLAFAGPAAAASRPPAEATQTAASLAINNARIIRNVAYGPNPRQRFDIYAPRNVRNAPVIFLVHGGNWQDGDKASPDLVDGKVAHWLPRGVIVVSTNYRLLPEAGISTQLYDVARALAVAQRQVVRAGGSPWRFVLMGHSTGAHLVALLDALPQRASAARAYPWLGTVLLDSPSVDLVELMRQSHPGYFDTMFGRSPGYWRAASPLAQLNRPTPPVLAVCSSIGPSPCPANQRLLDRQRALGGRGRLLTLPLSNAAINEDLGESTMYTRSVDFFLRTLGFGATAP